MLRRLLAPVVLALAFPVVLSAQSQATTGIIRGVVTDPAGAAVAGATVTLHELQTGFQRQLTTNERSEEHTSELQSRLHLVCRLLLEKKKTIHKNNMNSLQVPEKTL